MRYVYLLIEPLWNSRCGLQVRNAVLTIRYHHACEDIDAIGGEGTFHKDQLARLERKAYKLSVRRDRVRSRLDPTSDPYPNYVVT